MHDLQQQQFFYVNQLAKHIRLRELELLVLQMGAILPCCLPREERLPPRGPPPMALPPPPCQNAKAQQQAANEPQRVFPILNMPLIRVKPPPPHMAAHRGPPPNYDLVPVKPPPPHLAAYRGPLPVHEAAEGLPLVKAKPPPPFWRG